MVRAGFRSLLEAEPDLTVVGEATNGAEAVEVVSRLQPDVTLMDIRMPVLDGIVFEALRAGASRFLLKDAPAEELSAAIRVVAAGESLLAPSVTRRVIDAFIRRPAGPSRAVDRRLGLLTPRELEVLGLLARGLANSDIAQRLFAPRAPPRPMSEMCWPSWACGTGCRR